MRRLHAGEHADVWHVRRRGAANSRSEHYAVKVILRRDEVRICKLLFCCSGQYFTWGRSADDFPFLAGRAPSDAAAGVTPQLCSVSEGHSLPEVGLLK